MFGSGFGGLNEAKIEPLKDIEVAFINNNRLSLGALSKSYILERSKSLNI